MVDGNNSNSVLEFTYLSADYARDSGTTTMCPSGLNARYKVLSCCPPSYKEPRPGKCTVAGEKDACLPYATSAFMG